MAGRSFLRPIVPTILYWRLSDFWWFLRPSLGKAHYTVKLSKWIRTNLYFWEETGRSSPLALRDRRLHISCLLQHYTSSAARWKRNIETSISYDKRALIIASILILNHYGSNRYNPTPNPAHIFTWYCNCSC